MVAWGNNIPNMSSCAFCFDDKQYFRESQDIPCSIHMFLYVHIMYIGVESLPEHRAFLALLHIVLFPPKIKVFVGLSVLELLRLLNVY